MEARPNNWVGNLLESFHLEDLDLRTILLGWLWCLTTCLVPDATPPLSPLSSSTRLNLPSLPLLSFTYHARPELHFWVSPVLPAESDASSSFGFEILFAVFRTKFFLLR
jgi:hypothetical protein